jgi:hypothetical protein
MFAHDWSYLMSKLIDPIEDLKPIQHVSTNRRDFTVESALGLFAAILVSCGKRVSFNRKTEKGRSSEDLAAASSENPTGAETGFGDETNSSSPGGDGDGELSDEEKAKAEADAKADAEAKAEAAKTAAANAMAGKLDVSKAILGDNATILFKLYGAKNQAMVAFAKKDAAAGLQIGDTLHILAPLNTTEGQIIAQRQVFADNDKDTAHIFDNTYLVAIDVLWVVITRNNLATLFKIPSRAGDFEGNYRGKPVIDTKTLLDIGHGNYYDHMPVMEFSGPTTSVSGELKQFGSLRPYVLATNASTWATAKFQIVSSGTAFAVDTSAVKGIELTDAVGREIALASITTEITVSADFLRKTTTVVLYTNDNDEHWHRYFQFIG